MKKIIGNATLYLGDCIDVLPIIDNVDAVITDPPYGLNIAAQPYKKIGKRAEKKDWDNSTPDFDLMNLILNKGKKQIVWGGNYFKLPQSRCWLVWHKPDGLPSFSRVELAWTNMDKLAGYFQWSIAATNPERVGHPTQKPIALMKWCIDKAENPNTIFDPFMGSGSTGVAAVQMGKKFIGIERDPQYFEMACKRIENAQRQEVLF